MNKNLIALCFALVFFTSFSVAQAQDWPSYQFLKNLEGDFNNRMRSSDPSHQDVTFREFGTPRQPATGPTWGVKVEMKCPQNIMASTAATYGGSLSGYNNTAFYVSNIAQEYFAGMDPSDPAVKELMLLLMMHEYEHTTPCTPEDPYHPGGKDVPQGEQEGENAACDHIGLWLDDMEKACTRASEIRGSSEISITDKCWSILLVCMYYRQTQMKVNLTPPTHNCPNLPPGDAEDPDWKMSPTECNECSGWLEELLCLSSEGGPIELPEEPLNHNFTASQND